MSSLEKVRSSAAKKRAEKRAEKHITRDLDRHSQSNNNLSSSSVVSPKVDESGFFSMFSTMNSGVEDSLERQPLSKKKG